MDVFEGIFSTCRCEFEKSYPPEDAVQEEEEEEMATSQVIVLPRCGAVSAFPPDMPGLRICKTLVLCF